MEVTFRADGVELSGYLANPPTTPSEPPSVVLCHGFPTDELGAAAIGVTMPMLADRIANEGWRALAFSFRGCGRSTGNFSLGGWLDDLRTAIAWIRDMEATRGVWLAGFGTGGALAICGFGWRGEEMVTMELDPAGEIWRAEETS